MTFDINADISRQFTRDGRKVLAIVDSGLDITNPLAVWIEGESGSYSMTEEGRYLDYCDAKSDIITKPELNANSYAVQQDYLGELIDTYKNDSANILTKDIVILKAIKDNLYRLEGLDK